MLIKLLKARVFALVLGGFAVANLCFGAGTADPKGDGDQSSFEAQFKQANDHYNREEFAEAIRLYEGLLGAFPGHSRLHYNLASTYLRAYQGGSEEVRSALARSVYHYQRSLLQDPMNRNTRENFHIALSYVSSAYHVSADFFAFTWGFLKILQAKILLLNLLFVALGLVLVSCFARGRKQFPTKRTAFVVLLALVYVGVLFGEGMVKNIASHRARTKAVVLPQHVELRDQPSRENAEVVFDLYEGNIIEVSTTNASGDWVLTSLPNGRSGWLEQRHLLQFD